MRLITTVGVLILCVIHNISCDDDVTLVEVEQGQLRGQVLDAVVGDFQYLSYKGIPYAKPPVGKLRFKDPEYLDSWEGVLNATEHGSVCPQFNPITAVYTSGSEDCLFLNVYTRNLTPDAPRPVVVFIHGGAYIFGSGNTDLYRPDYLLANDVIVVTINYRLGVLGFLSLGNEAVPGNAALKDQVTALKWVQNNIEKFGGDPNSVTIVGDTAGGASVTLHMLSPMSKGLFHKAVAMSGSATCDFGLTYKHVEKAKIFGSALNCENVEDSAALLDCLQAADYNAFYSITPTVLASEEITDVLFKMEHFTPVIEKKTGNNFLTEDYYSALTKGHVNKDVDFIIGYSSQEAVLLIDLFNASYVDLYSRYKELFTPSEILIKSTPDTNLNVAKSVKEFYFGEKPVKTENLNLFVKYSSSASIGYHAQRYANKWANFGKKTYFYIFDGFTDWNFFGQQGVKYGIEKASHFDITYYLFYPESLNWSIDTDSVEYQVTKQLTTSLTNFAKSSDPSVDGVTWPQYSESSKAYVTFGNDGPVVGYGPDEDDYNFWAGVYKSAGIPF